MTLKILAFNTVTELCSVAIMVDQKIYSHNVLAPKLHAEKILPIINQLLIDSGTVLQSVDCIVFDQGPGSFIGLRIGINIAQGLSLGANLPLIGLSSLEVLAQGAYRLFGSKYVITTIDAKMRKLYWAYYEYDIVNKIWICKNNIYLLTTTNAQEMIDKLNGVWTIVGTGWNDNNSLKSHIENSDSIVENQITYPDARDMLSLGFCLYKKKKFLTPSQIIPVYPQIQIQPYKYHI